MMIIDVNGKISENKASISVLNAGYYFGFGIYETLLIKNSVPVFFELHIDRLQKALKYFDISWSTNDQSRLKERIIKLIKMVDDKLEYRLRIMITPGEVAFPKIDFENINSVLFLSPIPKRLEISKVKLYFNNDLKKSSSSFLPSYIKLTSNNKNLMSARQAIKNNCEQTLLVNDKGFITEASYSNFYFIKNSIVYTPSKKNNLLEGITRKVLIALSKEHGISLKTGCYTISDVLASDAAFISSSTKGIVSLESLLVAKPRDNKKDQIKCYHYKEHDLISRLTEVYQRGVEANIQGNQNEWQ